MALNRCRPFLGIDLRDFAFLTINRDNSCRWWFSRSRIKTANAFNLQLLMTDSGKNDRNKVKDFPEYLWRERATRWQIIIVIGLMILGAPAFSISWHILGLAERWQNWLEAFLAFLTIIVAAFIWLNEKKQDWENSLPKKLNVTFVFDQKPFYQVENAPLTGESDIRQWGQQIGRQMKGGNGTLFFTGFKTEGPVRDKTRQIMHYNLTIWLQSIDIGEIPKKWVYDDDGSLISISSFPDPELS